MSLNSTVIRARSYKLTHLFKLLLAGLIYLSSAFAVIKTDKSIDLVVKHIVSFFSKQRIKYWFLKSHKNLIFQYKSLEKDDYILLSSFINKITFF